MKLRFVVGIVGALGVVAAAGWWWTARPARLNVLLVTLDTTRADRLGCYGYAGAETPNLDRLAARGVVYERAYTVVPITLPAHATLHTGLLPPEHGLRINGVHRLVDTIPTLAEILKARGYRTGAFVSSLVLDARFGLARGFDAYDDRLGSGSAGPRAERSAAETISAALAWLETDSSRPVFCWVHLYDPHEPYQDHRDEFGDRFPGRPYDAEIAYLDRHLGRLFEWLARRGVEKRTFIVVAGDHGEGLGDHQEATHGYLAYNSTMHVPLLIQHPEGNQPGRRVAEPVSLADVFPTILDGLGIPPAQGTIGRSLAPWQQSSPLKPRGCYGETEAPLMEGGWSPLRTWTTARWKYIQSTRAELYDLEADPAELQNLIDAHPEVAAELDQALADFQSQLLPRGSGNAVLTAEERRALAGLGYAGGSSPPDDAAGPRRDIKDTLVHAEQVHRCMHLVDENRYGEAERILRDVVAALPDYAKAWGTLGICLARQEKHAEAEQQFRHALSLDARQTFARVGLGRVLFEQNKLEDCLEPLQTALEEDPSALDARYFLGEAYRKLRRWDEARAAFEGAVENFPDFTEAQLGLADVARDEGRLEEAAAAYERILERDPSALRAYLSRGHVLARLERDAEALQSLEELLRHSPRHVDGLVELARLLSTSGDPAVRDPRRAIEVAEQAVRWTDRRRAAPLHALAAAYAAAGRLDRAIQAAEQALELARGSGAASLAALIEDELDAWRARRAAPPR
jgi:arylsulfatase A-like enzyme/Tfp pilus assembly protein PilF